MKVIICGAGQVGFNIARQLATEGNEVVIIDTSEPLLRRVSDVLDVGVIVGHAGHPEVLERAGGRDAFMLIAVTHSDEVNMVACQVAHSIFQVPRRIARIRAQNYLEPRFRDMFRHDQMPIDVIISPEIEVADSVLRRLATPGAFETTPFLEGRARLLGARVEEEAPIVNTPLRQVTQLFPQLISRVVGFWREDKMHIPTPEDQLFPGDQVFCIAAEEHAARALELFGHKEQAARRIVLIGGGNIGLSVAQALEAQRGPRVRLIERDRTRAEYAAERLDRTIVLNGDGLSSDILEEANVRTAESLVTLTDDDKTNLLACVLAKDLGCQRTLALVNDQNLMRLMDPLRLDALINPRATTVSSILRHVRRGRIRAVYSIADGSAEVIEAQVLPTSPMAGRALRDADLPTGVILGAVLSGDKVISPHGALTLKEGDRVVLLALRGAVPQIERMFQVALEYF